jgi:diacylglycerol kinase family enzyme
MSHSATARTPNIVIAVNPKAGAVSVDDRVERLKTLLASEDFQVEVLSDLTGIASRANELHEQGRLRALIGVGGDGTAAELVNRTEPGTPLAILPAGNENLLARHFGIGPTPEECFHTLVAGHVQRFDAAQAGDRIFLLMLGCGFDADVVRRVHLDRRGHVQSLNYLWPIMESIRNYDYPDLRVYWDDETEGKNGSNEAAETVLHWLFAFNLPGYGAGLQIAPEADGNDGMLDVCTFRQGGLLQGLRYTAAIYLGMHREISDYGHRRVRSLRITSPGQVPYQLDGDPGGFLPVEVKVLPQRLTLILPQTAR